MHFGMPKTADLSMISSTTLFPSLIGTMRAKPHAAGSTGEFTVQSPHVSFPIFATDANKAIQGADVITSRTHHSFHKVINPLPTNIPLSRVNIERLYNLTIQHPNKQLVGHILHGLAYGFDIGFNGIHYPTKPKNLLSALSNKNSINEAIKKE